MYVYKTYFFGKITTFIKVREAFDQVLQLIYPSKIYQWKGLKPKNKGHTNFYECCDFTKKVYLMYTIEPLEVFLVNIIMWYLSCLPLFTLKYSQFFSPKKYSKKIFHCPMILSKKYSWYVCTLHNIGIVHIILVAYIIYSIYILWDWGCRIFTLRYDSLGWFHSVMLLYIFK